jgi:hypothetical protein
MRWIKIAATTAALSMAAASLPATAQAGHKYGHGYKPYHSKNVFVHKHRRSRGDALAAGIFGLAAGAIIGSALAQPRYPRHYYGGPAYAPAYGAPAPVYAAPIYGAPPVGSPDWYAYCASKYRSFDPTDGTFQPYNGPRRLCQ